MSSTPQQRFWLQPALGVVVGPEAHRDADDVVALPHEQPGRDGGIDAAAHCDDYALLSS